MAPYNEGGILILHCLNGQAGRQQRDITREWSQTVRSLLAANTLLLALEHHCFWIEQVPQRCLRYFQSKPDTHEGNGRRRNSLLPSDEFEDTGFLKRFKTVFRSAESRRHTGRVIQVSKLLLWHME